MNDPVLVFFLGAVATLVIFLAGLFTGWRFGRESLHLTPFSYPADGGSQPQDVVVDERDPWDDAVEKRVMQ